MDDNFGEWVESMGVASGWNLWVWLPCIGVASRCCYKEVYRYPHKKNEQRSKDAAAKKT